MSDNKKEKTPEELKKEQEQAAAALETLLNQNKPKNLREGLGSGLSNVLAGAIGAAGVAVITPTAGFAVGLRGGGIIGKSSVYG